MMGWIGVDLDGTLARYDGWLDGSIGGPIEPIRTIVERLLDDGVDVRIFTARVSLSGSGPSESGMVPDRAFVDDQVMRIEEWCRRNLGRVIPITSEKGYDCIEIWDDRARWVPLNSGQVTCSGLASKVLASVMADRRRCIEVTDEQKQQRTVEKGS